VTRRGSSWAALTSAILTVAFAGTASAAPSVKLGVGFMPDHPGVSTTVALAFSIGAQNAVPPPIVEVDFQLPAGMGLGTTDLGDVICTTSILEADGIAGCPHNSYMGLGEARVVEQFGPELVQETANIAILMSPAVGEHTTMLFLAAAETPVQDEVIFQGQLIDDGGPYGAQLITKIPLVATLPEAPYASVISMQATLGPRGLTYYRTAKGKLVPFRPNGMVVPASCPHGGYPFAATFTFLGGEKASATAAVPCNPHPIVGHGTAGRSI
jgi:hypothetical protein